MRAYKTTRTPLTSIAPLYIDAPPLTSSLPALKQHDALARPCARTPLKPAASYPFDHQQHAVRDNAVRRGGGAGVVHAGGGTVVVCRGDGGGAGGAAGVGERGGGVQREHLLHVPRREAPLLRHGRAPDGARAGPRPAGPRAGARPRLPPRRLGGLGGGRAAGRARRVHRRQAGRRHGPRHGRSHQRLPCAPAQGGRRALAVI